MIPSLPFLPLSPGEEEKSGFFLSFLSCFGGEKWDFSLEAERTFRYIALAQIGSMIKFEKH